MRRALLSLLVLAGSFGLGACGGGSKPVTEPPTVASVEISPSSSSIELGRTSSLTATPRTAAGEAVNGVSVTWTSSSPGVATVGNDGTVVSVAIGSVTITAAASGKSGTATVDVVAPTSPAARWLASAVYDDAQNRVLLFGGLASTGSTLRPLNDLWAWNGQRWSFLGASGPSPRGDLLASWDSDRHRLVVYGGVNDDGSLGDTWEWDGTAWTQRATGGPSLRRHFAGGYDSNRARVVLFGGLLGSTSTPALDTWEWDGAQWTQRATTVPPGFTAPARTMAYSDTRQALLMPIGSFSNGATEVWQWNGSAWTSVAAGPTTSMPVALAATGADEMTFYMSTGATVRWRGGTVSTLAAAGPGALDGVALAYDKSRSRLVLFGGLAGQLMSADTWLWDGSGWSRATQ